MSSYSDSMARAKARAAENPDEESLSQRMARFKAEQRDKAGGAAAAPGEPEKLALLASDSDAGAVVLLARHWASTRPRMTLADGLNLVRAATDRALVAVSAGTARAAGKGPAKRRAEPVAEPEPEEAEGEGEAAGESPAAELGPDEKKAAVRAGAKRRKTR